MAEEQVVEGYACICGFTTQDKKEFNSHVMHSAKRDGKGTHKSLGRINIETGDVIIPPWADRSPEDRERTRFGGLGAADNGDKKNDKNGEKNDKNGEKTGKSEKSGKDSKSVKSDAGISQTNILADAQQIRVVPRIFTMDYSPIMRAGQEAARRYWGWRSNMPLDNFIDTCLYLFFEEKGITLCGYIVDDSLLKKEDQDGS